MSEPLLATAASDACATCGTPLAPDQRYCVQCGTRRGPARRPAFESSTVVREVAPASAPPTARSWTAGSGTFVAGIGTLLLAMGVGVLIGHGAADDTPARAAAQPVKVVTVGGGGTVAAAAATATPAADAKGSSSKAKKAKAKSSSATRKAPSTVKGADVKLPAKAVVKVGQPGKGPGYENGKFTGNFFGN